MSKWSKQEETDLAVALGAEASRMKEAAQGILSANTISIPVALGGGKVGGTQPRKLAVFVWSGMCCCSSCCFLLLFFFLKTKKFRNSPG